MTYSMHRSEYYEYLITVTTRAEMHETVARLKECDDRYTVLFMGTVRGKEGYQIHVRWQAWNAEPYVADDYHDLCENALNLNDSEIKF